MQDASGAAYALSAGTIAADGREQDLTVQLGKAADVRYPLRLLGIALTYDWPHYGTTPSSASITIAGLAESTAASGAFGPPFAPGSALAAWHSTASAPDLAFLTRNGWDTGAAGPSLPSTRRTGSAAVITLLPGNGPHLMPAVVQENGLQRLPGLVTLTAPDRAETVPAMATSAFLASDNLHVGSTVPVPISTGLVRLHIVESVSRFPTITGTGAIIVDLGSLQAN